MKRPIALSLIAIVVLASCSAPKDEAAKETFSVTPLKASNFGDPAAGTNPWYPLKPGMQWVKDGTTLIGNRKVPNSVVTTVTDVVRVVRGVKTVLVYDHSVAAGQVVQESVDYIAEDKAGNVWDLGSTTDQYEAGRYIAVDEAWLDGNGKAKGGILVPANPSPSTPPWSIASTDEGGDGAEAVKFMKKCVAYGCFPKVLVVREGKKTALDNEFKYYAYGVGQIFNEPRTKSRHEDYEVLINIIQLTPGGLAEASKAALKIDNHGIHDFPKVFGNVTAKRVVQ